MTGISGIGGIGSIGVITGANAARGVAEAARGPQAVAKVEGDFLQALQQAAGETVQTLQVGEMQSIAGIAGKADIQTVVDQVMAAERTWSATLAIRNKLVAAWQEISRMQI